MGVDEGSISLVAEISSAQSASTTTVIASAARNGLWEKNILLCFDVSF